MKFACLFVVAVAMASLVMAVPLDTNEHENKPKWDAANVVAHLRRLIANIDEANTIPNEYSHINHRQAAVEGNIPFKFSDQPPTESLTDLYPGETNNPNPALTLTNKIGFGTADSYGMACGGAISLGPKTTVYGNILTSGVFSTGDATMIFGDVGCVGSAFLGSNADFNGNLISQGAVSIGANDSEPQAKFTGDISCMGAIKVGEKTEIIGNINSCAAFAPGPASSVTGLVLVGAFALPVPLSKDTKVLDDITSAYTNLWLITGGADLAVSIVGDELLPGIYCTVAKWGLPLGKTLTFNGSSSDTWIIQIDGAAVVLGEIALKGGALASNIQWVANGAVAIGTDCKFYGDIVASGAISVATGASVHGLMYTPAGACVLEAGASLATL